MKKRADGRYVETITIKGKRKYFYGKNKTEVKQKMMAYEEQTKGRYFPAVADEWWESTKNRITFGTQKAYHPAYIRAKNEFNVYTDVIQVSDVNQMLMRMARQSFAEKTVKNQKLVISLILGYAVSMGYITYNVARDAEIPRGLAKRKITIPSDEDIEKVKECYNIPFGMFPYMALYTGLRRGELLALTWEDVDLENGTIRVNKSLEYINTVPHVKEPKTYSGIRVVPILNALRDKLKKGRGIIFTNRNGEYIKERQFQYLWGSYVKATGIKCTPHQLRHAYATMLYEHQDIISLKLASQLLGHAQISTTADIYADIRAQHQKDVFDTMKSIDM